MKISRRNFLKAAGAVGVAGTLVERPLLHALAQGSGNDPEVWFPGEEKWVPSVCQQCPAGCGIRVRVVEGRAVKIAGTPRFPINLGRLCPKGQAGLQVLYDPDRIKGPMVRAGDRGKGKWRSVSWDEALQTLGRRLKELRGRGEAHTLLFLTGRTQGQMEPLITRFLEAYGSPNLIRSGSIGTEALRLGHYLTQGVRDYLGYDWDNVNYLVCFGASFIEACRPTTRLQRAYAHMRRGEPGKRVKIVQVDPRFSISAAKADEWVPIRPGTDGALALGIAHVLVKETLYDIDFVRERCFGFYDWTDDRGQNHQGFRTVVLSEYPPDLVASITGISMQTIYRLAEEFARNRPAVALGGRGACLHSNGPFNQMAIHALNALVGSIESPGGAMVQIEPPLAPFPPVVQDEVAKTGTSMPLVNHANTPQYPFGADVFHDLPKRIQEEDPYPVNMMLLYYTNPLYSVADTYQVQQIFSKVPFIVSFSPFMDESTSHADLILPDHTYLERWQDTGIEPTLGFPVFGLRQPVVRPLYDTRNTGDVLLTLAKGLGGSVAESLPWESFPDLIRSRAQGLHRAQSGSIITNSFEEFWAELLEEGGWWDTQYTFGEWERAIRTPDHKFAFYSTLMEDRFREITSAEARQNNSTKDEEMEKLLRRVGITARGDKIYMPHFEPLTFVGDEKAYTFYLNTYKTMTQAEGRGANQPWLQEIYGLHVKRIWDSWVEINPDVAKAMNIADGDWVWIESLVSKVKVHAKLYPGILPEVVSIPHGQGHKGYGRWAQGRGVNPNWIMKNECNLLGGTAAWSSTRVRVYKA